MINVGTIPETLKVVFFGPTNFGCFSTYQSKQKTVDCFPAFFVPGDNPKRLLTAKTWAENYCSYRNSPLKSTIQEISVKNEPFSLQIVDLDRRFEGGRAYKVLMLPDGNIPQKFLVDLREETLMDAILHVGISPDGLLNGSYLWANVGQSWRIIRENSYLHQEILKFTQNVNLETKSIFMGDKNKKPGSLYVDKQGVEYLFVDNVQTQELVFKKYNPGWEVLPNQKLSEDELKNLLLVRLSDVETTELWVENPRLIAKDLELGTFSLNKGYKTISNLYGSGYNIDKYPRIFLQHIKKSKKCYFQYNFQNFHILSSAYHLLKIIINKC